MPPAFLPWKSDLEAAQAEASTAKRKLLLCFGARWCSGCQQLEAEFLDPRVQKLLANFVLVKMDLSVRNSSNPAMEVARKFNVYEIPNLRVLSPEGKELGVIDSEDADDLVAQMEPHVKG